MTQSHSLRTADLYFKKRHHCDCYVGRTFHRDDDEGPIISDSVYNFLAEQLYLDNEDAGCEGVIWERAHTGIWMIGGLALYAAYYWRYTTWAVFPDDKFASNYIDVNLILNSRNAFMRCKDFAISCSNGETVYSTAVIDMAAYTSRDGLDWRQAATIPVYDVDKDGKEFIAEYKNPVRRGRFSFSDVENRGIMISSNEDFVYRIDIDDEGIMEATKISESSYGGRIIGDHLFFLAYDTTYAAMDPEGHVYNLLLPYKNHFAGRESTIIYDHYFFDGVWYALATIDIVSPYDSSVTNIVSLWESKDYFKTDMKQRNLFMWNTGRSGWSLDFFDDKKLLIQSAEGQIRIWDYGKSFDNRPNIYLMSDYSVMPMCGNKSHYKNLYAFRNNLNTAIVGKDDWYFGWGYQSVYNSGVLYFEDGKIIHPKKYVLEISQGGHYDYHDDQAYYAVSQGVTRSSGLFAFNGTANGGVIDSGNQTWPVL